MVLLEYGVYVDPILKIPGIFVRGKKVPSSIPSESHLAWYCWWGGGCAWQGSYDKDDKDEDNEDEHEDEFQYHRVVDDQG